MIQTIETTTTTNSPGSKPDPGALQRAEKRMQEEWKQMREAEQQLRLEALRDLLGRRYKVKTFDNFEPERQGEALKKAKAYVSKYLTNGIDDRNGLLIMGPCGTGKTHLAAAITNSLIDAGHKVIFGTFDDHLDRIKAEFNSEDPVYIEEIRTCPLLIIDDLYDDNTSDWALRTLFAVINTRSRDGLPVIITTNLTQKQLKNYVGDRIFSRLAGMCRAIVMDGPDMRMR